MMNKIIIGNEKFPHLIVDKISDYKIIVNENVENKLVIIGTNNYQLDITLKENSKFECKYSNLCSFFLVF